MSNVELYQGDCLEVMKNIPDGSVDLILTDPPYGTTACKWDSIIPFEPMWEQLNRIIKPNGAIILFGSEPFSSVLRISNIKNYKYDWYWKKERPTNIFQVKRRPAKYCENIMVFYNKQCTYNETKIASSGKIVKNNPKGNHSITTALNKIKVTPYQDDGTRHPCEILEYKRDVQKSKLHPTQKPVALLEYLIKTYTLEGETVLDFTMGSGSTGVACLNTNRNFIGIELDKNYFTIAENRIKQANEDGSAVIRSVRYGFGEDDE